MTKKEEEYCVELGIALQKACQERNEAYRLLWASRQVITTALIETFWPDTDTARRVLEAIEALLPEIETPGVRMARLSDPDYSLTPARFPGARSKGKSPTLEPQDRSEPDS